MTTTFNTAIEARTIVDTLQVQVGRLPYNSDLHKFCNNISAMVSDLSKLEVYTRRTPPRSRYHMQYKKLSNEIQGAIKHLDQLMLMAKLMA